MDLPDFHPIQIMMNYRTTLLPLLLFSFLFLESCTPDELVWDLPATNPVHDTDGGNGTNGPQENLELCGSNDCTVLSGVNAETTSGPSWEEWEIGTGYQGQGFVSRASGYVEFNLDVEEDFRVRFWLSSFEAGYWSHDIPDVHWNGSPISAPIHSGNNEGGDGDDWVQRQTERIPAGSGILRIEFPQNSRIYFRRLDGVEWWCIR